MATMLGTGARWSRPAAVAVVLAVALAALVVVELTGALMSRPDSAVLDWMLAHRSGGLTRIAVPITHSGTARCCSH